MLGSHVQGIPMPGLFWEVTEYFPRSPCFTAGVRRGFGFSVQRDFDNKIAHNEFSIDVRAVARPLQNLFRAHR